jgi:hypothetical protein
VANDRGHVDVGIQEFLYKSLGADPNVALENLKVLTANVREELGLAQDQPDNMMWALPQILKVKELKEYKASEDARGNHALSAEKLVVRMAIGLMRGWIKFNMGGVDARFAHSNFLYGYTTPTGQKVKGFYRQLAEYIKGATKEEKAAIIKELKQAFNNKEHAVPWLFVEDVDMIETDIRTLHASVVLGDFVAQVKESKKQKELQKAMQGFAESTGFGNFNDILKANGVGELGQDLKGYISNFVVNDETKNYIRDMELYLGNNGSSPSSAAQNSGPSNPPAGPVMPQPPALSPTDTGIVLSQPNQPSAPSTPATPTSQAPAQTPAPTHPDLATLPSASDVKALGSLYESMLQFLKSVRGVESFTRANQQVPESHIIQVWLDHTKLKGENGFEGFRTKDIREANFAVGNGIMFVRGQDGKWFGVEITNRNPFTLGYVGDIKGKNAFYKLDFPPSVKQQVAERNAQEIFDRIQKDVMPFLKQKNGEGVITFQVQHLISDWREKNIPLKVKDIFSEEVIKRFALVDPIDPKELAGR